MHIAHAIPYVQAMDQMSRMTPQQMADMQRQMASLPPGFVQQQMEAMKSMDSAQLQRSMTDADNNGSQGQSQGSSRSLQEVCATAPIQHMNSTGLGSPAKSPGVSAAPHWTHSVSVQVLKEEGNRLFSQGRYAEAAAKYERAKSELTGDCPAPAGPCDILPRRQQMQG